MISWHAFLLYCGVYAVAIITPGPGVMAIVARALGSGFRSTLPMVLGTLVGDLTLLTLVSLGLSLMAQAMGSLFMVVKLGGAAYLIYLAYKYWTAEIDLGVTPVTARNGFWAQYALTIGNPKALAFFLALLPTVIDLKHLSLTGYLQLGAATIVLIPAITLGYAALASRLRSVFASVVARRRMNKGAAAFLAGAGVGVVVS